MPYAPASASDRTRQLPDMRHEPRAYGSCLVRRAGYRACRYDVAFLGGGVSVFAVIDRRYGRAFFRAVPPYDARL